MPTGIIEPIEQFVVRGVSEGMVSESKGGRPC